MPEKLWVCLGVTNNSLKTCVFVYFQNYRCFHLKPVRYKCCNRNYGAIVKEESQKQLPTFSDLVFRIRLDQKGFKEYFVSFMCFIITELSFSICSLSTADEMGLLGTLVVLFKSVHILEKSTVISSILLN